MDHIKPYKKYPELVLCKDNLQVLCKRCNFAKSFIESRQRMLEVDDMDFVARAKNIRRHFGVPESGLMAEMHASSQHIPHRYTHCLVSGLVIRAFFPCSNRMIHRESSGTREHVSKNAVFCRRAHIKKATVAIQV